MTRRRPSFLAAACVLLALAASAWAQEDKGAAAAKASSSLRGRVVYEDTNEAVRRAEVTLVRLESGAAYDAEFGDGAGRLSEATDERGEYSFSKLPPGNYLVTVSAAGAVTPGMFSQRTVSFAEAVTSGAPLDERLVELDGEAAAEHTLRVRRGGAISGRVAYADGEAATNVQLTLYCRETVRWSRCGAPAGTDDRGAYRFEGLPPGEYVVGAAEKNVDGDAASDYSNENSFSGAYHPSARSASAAEPVRVEAGRETEDVDVTFGDDARVVSGQVVWKSDGRPAAGAAVQLRSAAQDASPFPYTYQDGNLSGLSSYLMASAVVAENRMTNADEEGRFTFEGVPEGEFFISATATHGDGTSFAQKSQRVSLSGADLKGLDLRLPVGGRISGRVVVEGGGGTGPVYFSVRSTDRADARPHVHVVTGDGSFSVEGMGGGEFFIEVYLLAPTSSRYVRSVTGPDGADLTHTPLRLAEGEAVDGVRVVLADGGATLRGRVHAAAGRPPFGVDLFLIPADPSLWGVRARQFYTATGLDGSFTLNCPPGEYLLLAMPEGDSRAAAADLVRAHGASALRVVLAPGERKEVEVSAPEARPAAP